MFFIKFLFTMLNLNKKIFLVRHAQSMANVGLKTENPQNNHLTELGKIQANELLNKIKEVPDYICYSKYVLHATLFPTALHLLHGEQALHSTHI